MYDAAGQSSGVAMVRLKRVYAAPEPGDGVRVLIDRLWPRGLSKSDAAIDLWLKEIAPSAELRNWFAHEPERWTGFQARYREELTAPERADALQRLRSLVAEREVVTLLFGAREERYNNAVLLRTLLDE